MQLVSIANPVDLEKILVTSFGDHKRLTITCCFAVVAVTVVKIMALSRLS